MLDALHTKRSQGLRSNEPHGGIIACKLLVDFYAGLEDDLLGPMASGYGKLPTSDEQDLEMYNREWGRRFANRGRAKHKKETKR